MEDPVLEYSILNAVAAQDGQVTQRDISQKLGRSVASVNFALRLLTVKGFIKISGANRRNLRYHLTPSGVLQKSILAYNFLVRQRALYEEVRTGLLDKLHQLRREGIRKVSIYGWTPFTESAMLFLLSERIQVTEVYVEKMPGVGHCNGIHIRRLTDYQPNSEVMVLLEPLPPSYKDLVSTPTVNCFPGSPDTDVAAQEYPSA